jgi:general secretion pathway protein J
MIRQRQSEAGFTLIELLVAIMLMGFMAVVMTTGLRIGIRSWRLAQEDADRSAQVSAVQRTLSRIVESTHAEFASSDRQDNRLFFEGQSDQVTLIATLPEAIAHDVVARQTLYIDRGRSDGRRPLILDWALDLPGANGDRPPTQQAPIIASVQSFTIRYWGKFDGDRDAGWHEVWSSQEHLPELVHLEIGLSDSAPLIVDARVSTTNSPACVYDAVTLRCFRL